MSVSSSQELIEEIAAKKRESRRRFLKTAGIGTAGIAGAGILAGGARAAGATLGRAQMAVSPSPASPVTDADVLNFALNLEYLEANFYTMATTGRDINSVGIPVTGTGTQGGVTGGSKLSFPDTKCSGVHMDIRDVFDNVAEQERQHVATLRAALGAAAVAQPAINLNALGFGFGSLADFLNLARLFEDTGVAAYSGAAPLIASKAYLSAAARILSIEGEHSGNIRALVVFYQANQAPSAAAIAKLRLGLGQAPVDGIYFSAYSPYGLGQAKTAAEVLAIVYATPNASSGGFFPAGVNGAITKSASNFGQHNSGAVPPYSL